MINPITRFARWWLHNERTSLRDEVNFARCESKKWYDLAMDAQAASRMHMTIASNFQIAQEHWHEDMDALYRDAYPKLPKDRKKFWEQKIGLPA